MYIIINDHQYPAKPGQTILEAAQENAIIIPTLCYDSHLSVTGACRICLVELADNQKLVTACTTEVQDGMQIITNSPKVLESRKMILDLLLSDHPLDCMICEANGACTLQDLAYEYGLDKSSFGTKTEPRYSIQSENPFIVYDPDKCILCGKCVRVDQEIQCSDAIDFVERGFITKVATPFDQGLGGEASSCVFCGQCVEKCPTAALTYKPAKGKGRDYEFSKVQTTCPYCGVGCQLVLKVKDNQIVQVGSFYQEGLPNPAGEACVKGRFGYDFVHHPNRLTTPLIKRNGEFEEATWEEAIAYVAQKFSEIKAQHGPRSIGGLASAKCTNEENYIMQKFIRSVIGTNSVDHCARLCHASTVAGLAKSFGSGAMTNSIEETTDTDVFFVIGSNPTENHPVIGSRIIRAVRNGAKLIVADPREIDLSKMAQFNLKQQPGTDVALINGLMHVIISEGLQDKEFIEQRTEDFELVESLVSEYTPEMVEEITGVAAEQLRQAARLYAKAEKAAIYFAMGITQHKTGTDNVLSLANLAMLTGNLGKRGAGVNPLRGQNNVQGACDMGALPVVYPGYQSVVDENVQKKFEKAWGVQLSNQIGLTVTEMIKASGEEIRAIYIMGENPMISDPDQNHVKACLEKLDFLVVQDIFLSETAQFAHVVLPATSFAEKKGTFTNTERRAQLVNKAVTAPGQAKADWEIICMIATKMGYPMTYNNEAEILGEISTLTPSYAGMNYDRLQGLGLQWPCLDENHPGTPILHREKFTRGKGKFFPVIYIPPEESVDEEYDHIMMTGRMLYHFHTGTMTRRSAAINEFEPDAYVEMNSKDAQKLGVQTKDRVRVISRRGEVETYAHVGERVREGHLFMPFHYAESPANRLTISVTDPIAKIPELKVAAVRIEKV